MYPDSTIDGLLFPRAAPVVHLNSTTSNGICAWVVALCQSEFRERTDKSGSWAVEIRKRKSRSYRDEMRWSNNKVGSSEMSTPHNVMRYPADYALSVPLPRVSFVVILSILLINSSVPSVSSESNQNRGGTPRDHGSAAIGTPRWWSC